MISLKCLTKEVCTNCGSADFCPFHNEQERALVTFNGTKNQREMAQKFWDSTTKKYPWLSNPWVWVIEFKKV